MKRVEEGIYEDASGYEVKVKVGSGKAALKDRARFTPDTEREVMRTWRAQARAKLMTGRQYITAGTLAANVEQYLKSANITPETKKRRTQQLGWLCAQPAALGGPVLSPEDVKDRIERKAAKPTYKTLGDMKRSALDPRRLREVFTQVFAPSHPQIDPTEFASTSNKYLTALLHLFSELDQDNPGAINPAKLVKARAEKGPQPKGQDARVVAEILRHLHAGVGRRSRVSHLRLECLAWIHITPTQLMEVDPPHDFHDVPDATRDDILDGAVTLTKQPRRKGRKNRPLPPPETIPLNHLGVPAMRAFAAEPAAWGKFSISPLNRMFKSACGRAQVALAKRGVVVDLSDMTLYHLKHSLATTASLASAGLVNRQGVIQQSPGVQRAIDHASANMTAIYTQAAVDPIVRMVNRSTMLLLENLLRHPLRGPNALRLVQAGGE